MGNEWDPLDSLIVEGRRLRAIMWIRTTFDCGLQEAIAFLYVRYEHLRQTRPDDFTESPEEYWRGVYT
ncbi:hypothetical protein GCM10010191_40900 [Actinomadura vinacea]|uniref:Uncharacterized protein n=1 Tax=Actinomadura vinacea TaxID=115336 RepID=A0ABN3J945_9ACTN